MKNKNPSEFATWLAKEMRFRRLSARAMAKEVGVSHTAVTKWLLGQHLPEPESIDGLARCLGVDRILLYKLMGRVDELAETEVTPEELSMLKLIRSLRPEERNRALTIIVALRDNPVRELQHEL